MADITMCVSKTCPIQLSCYRSTAIPNDFRQSYADFSNYLEVGIGGYECKQLIPIKKE